MCKIYMKIEMKISWYFSTYITVSKHKMYLKVSKLGTYRKLFEIMIIAKLPSLFKDSYL